ncbi:hypothetical protein V8E53_007931 [Lactarius tabidus]
MDQGGLNPRHFGDSSGYPVVVEDGEYILVSEGHATHGSGSHGTPIVDQDQVAHSPSGQSEPEDLGYIVSPSGLLAQPLGEINAPKSTISKRANSTVTGIGVIAGGVLVAFLAVLLLGVLPCYLKRRRARRQKPNAVDTEKATVTQVPYEAYNKETPLSFAKPLSVVNEESLRSVLTLSHASSETAVHTVETEERRSPPPLTRPPGTPNRPLSPPSSLRRLGDRTRETLVPTSPQRVLLRPDGADNDRDRGQLGHNAPTAAPMRSRSVRFAERNSRAMPSSPQTLLPNPWGNGENTPPQQTLLPGSSSERVHMFQLPESATSEQTPRRARSLKAAGLPRNPRDLPVSLRAETRSPSIPDSASDYSRSAADARYQSRAI